VSRYVPADCSRSSLFQSAGFSRFVVTTEIRRRIARKAAALEHSTVGALQSFHAISGRQLLEDVVQVHIRLKAVSARCPRGRINWRWHARRGDCWRRAKPVFYGSDFLSAEPGSLPTRRISHIFRIDTRLVYMANLNGDIEIKALLLNGPGAKSPSTPRAFILDQSAGTYISALSLWKAGGHIDTVSSEGKGIDRKTNDEDVHPNVQE
jgi:hypothetical protein